MAGDRLVDRRTFLHGSATLAAVSGLGVLGPAISARAGVMDDPVPVELFPFRMAMHVHACFSEGDASMEAHLQQAELNGIDVIWWTEHDHRMVARSYLTQVHFNGVSEYTNGTSLTWRSRFEGALASSSASFITSPVSPNDLGGRSLELTAKTSGSSSGTRRLVADVKSYGLNTSIVGTTLSIDVLPRTVGLDAWSDIRLRTSYRPARGGRTAGEYTIIYRVGGSRPVGSRKLLDPLTSLVVVDAPVDVWTTLLLDPVTDLNTFWPGVDFRDSALLEFSLAATSRSGTTSQVVFDELTVARAGRERDVVMATQQEFVDAYASQFPTVTQYRGMEMSESTPHLGWLGNPQIWLVGNPANQDVALAVQRIHEGGGVASYNHPYGSSGGPYSSSQRTTKRRSITSTLVSEALFGADI
ncbi:MAG TPA: hypothetical protein VMT88_09495, partial [Actinomycetes bacterium]|nr:hypothetical protein [Actinomycetes bacterium]